MDPVTNDTAAMLIRLTAMKQTLKKFIQKKRFSLLLFPIDQNVIP